MTYVMAYVIKVTYIKYFLNVRSGFLTHYYNICLKLIFKLIYFFHLFIYHYIKTHGLAQKCIPIVTAIQKLFKC